jgi:NitT/TauT family transport system permease protein
MHKSSTASDYVYPTVTVLLLIVVWEGITHFGILPSYVLPAPREVMTVLISDWSLLLSNAVSTTVAIVLGFLMSVAIGVPLAVLIATSRVFEKSVYPLLIGSQAIPKLALAPLFVVWFGFGLLPKVLMTFLIAVFPIVVSTVQGILSVERELEFLAKSMGLGEYRTFVLIRFYRALPEIFSGLKVAVTLAVVGAVVGEFTGSDRGLGTLLLRAIGVVNTPMLFAALIVLTALAIILFVLLSLLERVLIPWHISQRRDSMHE